MVFKQYSHLPSFYQDVYPLLMLHETQNLIPLGNLIIGYEGKDQTGWRNPAHWFMATVKSGTTIHLVALMTPPHNLTLYATGNHIHPQAVHCLIQGLTSTSIPGILAEKTLAEYFSKAYTSFTGKNATIAMKQRIYELTHVSPTIETMGKVRLLEEKDLSFFPYWLEAFHTASTYGTTIMPIPQEKEPYLYHVATKKMYILEDKGVPVSMAGYTREMENATSVSKVYTPPYYRQKGYATSLVAQISQLALEKRFVKCVLYTDLANPTSNSIYQKIGYQPVCDSLQIHFQ